MSGARMLPVRLSWNGRMVIDRGSALVNQRELSYPPVVFRESLFVLPEREAAICVRTHQTVSSIAQAFELSLALVLTRELSDAGSPPIW